MLIIGQVTKQSWIIIHNKKRVPRSLKSLDESKIQARILGFKRDEAKFEKLTGWSRQENWARASKQGARAHTHKAAVFPNKYPISS